MSADNPTPDDDAATRLVLPTAVVEDLEDLKAQLREQAAQLAALREQISAEPADAIEDAAPTDAAPEAVEQEQSQEGEEEEQYPPFIFLLEGEQYEAELRGLIEWVEGVLVPGYLDEPSAERRWCHRWFDADEHPVAVARLHALWLAWQECTDPASCGYTGPSVWHRDHYDPCMAQLRASNGPFQGCTKNEHQITHRAPSRVPSAWYQTDETDQEKDAW